MNCNNKTICAICAIPLYNIIAQIALTSSDVPLRDSGQLKPGPLSRHGILRPLNNSRVIILPQLFHVKHSNHPAQIPCFGEGVGVLSGYRLEPDILDKQTGNYMLTVNYTKGTPSYTTENIFSAKEVIYRTVYPDVLQSAHDPDYGGVTIVMPDNSEISHPIRKDGGTGFFERFYVMNEQGKTIATYSI